MDVTRLVDEFLDYVNMFDMNDDIKLKKEHSIRVMKLNTKYAIKLGFDEHDIELAGVIGLLHDIGRFGQLSKYKSYDDYNIDHADLGVKILFENNLIKKFWDNEEDYEIIRFAIQNHNKFTISDCDDERMLKHAKLIRDIDKLDIIYLFGFLGVKNLKPVKEEINPKIIEMLNNNQMVFKTLVNSVNDNIILMYAYVFDVNYDVCLDEFKNNLYYLYRQVNFDSKFKKMYDKVNNYIENRLEKAKN